MVLDEICTARFLSQRLFKQHSVLAMMKKYGSKKKRFFPGPTHCIKKLREADLAIMPSRTEGFSFIGLEALVAGEQKPVSPYRLCTDTAHKPIVSVERTSH